MPINGQELLRAAPIINMVPYKETFMGVSHGLSEVGYDLRVKQSVYFYPPDAIVYGELLRMTPRPEDYIQYQDALRTAFFGCTVVEDPGQKPVRTIGRTALASSVEEFNIPANMWGELRNKSTYARRFIDATIGTDAEPGWKGFLTIEIIFHANEPVEIHGGSGILKAVFHRLSEDAQYDGKYQHQEDRPVPPKFA